jgi:hypothetical protein
MSKADYEKLSASRINVELQKIRDNLKDLKRDAE